MILTFAFLLLSNFLPKSNMRRVVSKFLIRYLFGARTTNKLTVSLRLFFSNQNFEPNYKLITKLWRNILTRSVYLDSILYVVAKLFLFGK